MDVEFEERRSTIYKSAIERITRMEATEHAPGTFCWVELTTTDAARAKSLYSKLFGWEFVDNPMGPDMVYTVCQLNGKTAAALYEAHDANNPPHWELSVCVGSANDTAARRSRLGRHAHRSIAAGNAIRVD